MVDGKEKTLLEVLAGKEKTQRRVYVLPTDLVDRIVAYQKKMGLASEVEAARRLLDDALKYHDDYEELIGRFLARYKQVRTLREAARDILADHPLISSISYKGNSVYFEMTSGFKVEISSSGTAHVLNEEGKNIDLFEAIASKSPKKQKHTV